MKKYFSSFWRQKKCGRLWHIARTLKEFGAGRCWLIKDSVRARRLFRDAKTPRRTPFAHRDARRPARRDALGYCAFRASEPDERADVAARAVSGEAD